MAIVDLTNTVPIPNTPVEAGNSMALGEVAAKLGTGLPDDLYELGRTYGSGRFARTIRIYNPFARMYLNMVGFMANTYRRLKAEEGDEYIPFGVHPTVPGLLPLGDDFDGNRLFWLTEGEPNIWPVMLMTHGGKFERWQLSITTFLSKIFRAEIGCVIWEQAWLAKHFKGAEFEPEELY